MAPTEHDKAVGARLRKARKDAGFETMEEAAARYEWSPNSMKSHENGQRGLKLHVARKYAAAYGADVHWILTGESRRAAAPELQVLWLPIYGEAAGGVWREGPDEPLTEAPEIAAVSGTRFAVEMQYARQCIGNSVNKHVNNGEYAICVRLDGYPGGPRDGDLVDVARYRGGQREHTLKVYRIVDGRHQLHADSSDPDIGDTPLALDNGEDGVTVEIQGVVISATRLFKR
ncbi:MAG: helix-turn-helix domain-containing protein [Pseudomonadota bacterium]